MVNSGHEIIVIFFRFRWGLDSAFTFESQDSDTVIKTRAWITSVSRMDVGFDNFVFLGILVVLSKSVASDVRLVLGISVCCLFAVDKVVSASHHEVMSSPSMFQVKMIPVP